MLETQSFLDNFISSLLLKEFLEFIICNIKIILYLNKFKFKV